MSDEIKLITEVAPGGMPVLHAGIRFALELARLTGIAMLGWHVGSGGVASALLAAIFLVVTSAIWVIFGAEGDSGRGNPVIPVPGWIRFVVEMAIFGISAYGIWVSWSRAASETFLTVTALHYAVTWERTRWLLRGSNDPSKAREA